MIDFKDVKYQHIERWGTDEVEYLKNCDTLTVQPKLDGTNGVVVCEFSDDGTCTVKAGSRNRFLTIENDNYGFAKYVQEREDAFLGLAFAVKNDYEVKYIVFYGEFATGNKYKIIPQKKNTFIMFDIYVMYADNKAYWYNPYDFSISLVNAGIDFVPSLEILPSEVDKLTETHKEFSRFAVTSNFPHGEGFVIKDYGMTGNPYGRCTWAKIVYEKPNATHTDMLETVLNEWFSEEYLEKEYCKYLERFPKENPVKTQKFANLVSREFIKEETANMVFKFNFPEIDFAKLFGKLTKKALYFANAKNTDSEG